jgi:cytidylate kinase
LAEKGGIIMDGRDIGTVVLPNADYKFFLLQVLMKEPEEVIRN